MGLFHFANKKKKKKKDWPFNENNESLLMNKLKVITGISYFIIHSKH